jgi:SpoVK/Ycf46/Vps4 family AAA+-type ATPase
VRDQKQSGVNILIYGEPGTGKTELVSVLAKSLGTKLYQVSNEDSDGDSIQSHARICAYQMAQRVLRGKKKALLLFDEIEDIFPAGFIHQRHQMPNKAWFNNLLENNEVPAFWLSNNIQQIDSAYIRRFDYVLELKTPPKSVRKQIIKNNLGELVVSEHWLEHASQDQQLVPGVIARAVKVISAVHHTNQQSVQDGMDRILDNTLRAMGKNKVRKPSTQINLQYQLDALNPNYDIHQLLDGLSYESSARLCLYGPAGTGKTAFGHYISTRLDKPLIVKRASDILSPYVGAAEQNMAAMFEDARMEGAVLLLDEADSFLQERSSLKQSWEVTQVNELLTQMEAFEGLFVCSTNLMDKLDTAALRRFDFKIKLDYLNVEQAWLLFCDAVGWDKKRMFKETDWYRKLSAYNNLTPGDFANVLRQNRLYNRQLTPDELMAGLAQESTFKQDRNQKREIGFHAAH